LRDRYLERLNDQPDALRAMGKYEVSRSLGATIQAQPKEHPLLIEAAIKDAA